MYGGIKLSYFNKKSCSNESQVLKSKIDYNSCTDRKIVNSGGKNELL